jgi:hypothetical protein
MIISSKFLKIFNLIMCLLNFVSVQYRCLFEVSAGDLCEHALKLSQE